MKNIINGLILGSAIFAGSLVSANCITDVNSKKCSSSDLSEIDSILNTQYSSLINILAPDAKASLTKAQRQWIYYRDSVCDFEKNHLTPNTWYMESAKGVMRLNCLTRLTKDRVSELSEYTDLIVNNGNTFGLNGVIELSQLTLTSRSNNRSVQIASIISWIDDLSSKVKKATGKEFSSLSELHKGKRIYFHKNIYATTSENLRFNSKGGIGDIERGFLLVAGDCNISHARNSIILCTGNAHVSHSVNNIVISNGNIDISHDGSVGTGSLIVSKHFVEVSHSNSSVFVSAKNVKISHARNSDCVNTDTNTSSHGSCKNIKIATIDM